MAVVSAATHGEVLRLDGVGYCTPGVGRRGRRVPSRRLLTDVSLSVARGESVAVMGPSGSGKSTLLAICLGMLRPSEGVVRVAGAQLGRLRHRDLARLRAESIGVVFQAGELLPELSPLDNVALPAMLAGGEGKSARARAADLLMALGVDAAHTPTSALSGGERQRVAVARALINEPQLVLADEPTGSLDGAARDSVANHVFGLPGRLGCALLVVTHDERVAARADRVVDLLDRGLRVRL